MTKLADLKFTYREVTNTLPGSTVANRINRLGLILFCLPNLQAISAWLRARDNPLLALELSRVPEIREFLFRPYVNRYWSIRQRLDVIANHYQLVNSHAPLLNLAHDEWIELTHFPVGDKWLRVVIDRPSWMRREGEVGLSIFLGNDRIYTVMFLLSGTSGELKLIVGNVQGDGRNRTDVYKKLTKIMHGMRPRDFLLHILKMIGDKLGCNQILGISDNAHRSSLWYSKAHKLAMYDSMWLEHGGVKGINGFFILQARIEKRTDDDIPPNKRALYRRRYQFLDELQLKIEELVAFPPSKKPIDTMHAQYFDADSSLKCNFDQPS